ncbi:Putative Cytoplasmic protein [Clostridium chauvoei JF4335]|nr:Putative Cytoplasmic protein [Clostridium chauvoei JF4335]
MSETHDNFIKTDTQGSIGDRKCDGYLFGEGIFFQVYGPRDYSSNMTTMTEAIKKMPGDFEKLKEHIQNGYWEEIHQYIFVFKTHRGTYPDLLQVIHKLKRENPNIEFMPIYDINKLLSIFLDLSTTQMMNLTNTYIPEPNFNDIKYEVMGEIIQHLIKVGNTNNIDITKTPPNFDDKLEFNKINPFYASNLRTASYSIEALDDFLSSYEDIAISDTLCSIFKELYDQAQKKYPNDSNLQFKYILDNCHKENLNPNSLQQFETNSYVMIAKYFETCDIFEEPKKVANN